MENFGRRARLFLRSMSRKGLQGYIFGIKKSIKTFKTEMKNLYPGATIDDSCIREMQIAKNILKTKKKKNERQY